MLPLLPPMFVYLGKWTGIVTTSRVTHATPAATYASVAERNWEDDTNVPEGSIHKCPDIASQLIDDSTNQNIRVSKIQ